MAVVRIPVFSQEDNYVFIPACCYAGNQFEVKECKYPPMFTKEEARLDMPVTITSVPRLNKDGSGKIEVTTGDAATPCVGVFSAIEKKGIFVFTIQQINGKNIGLAYEKGEIRLTWPAKREYIYRMATLIKNEVPWVDEPAQIPYKVMEFPCENICEFLGVFFQNRKIMEMDASRPSVLPFDEQFEVQKEKYNTMNWHEGHGIYTVGVGKGWFNVWQAGWVGGGMTGYALMKLGGELEEERAMRTFDFVFSIQTECGLIHGMIEDDGLRRGDAFGKPGQDDWHLIRKSADVFYFMFKHFALLKERGKEIPKQYLEGAKKLADCFVGMWKKYGQFGQFVDVNTADIYVGGSTSGGIIPAGLAKAYEFWGDEIYLKTAEESAKSYYEEHLCKGYTTGGPGEILQGVDSESGAGLLESFVILYEITGKEYWLNCAKDCVHYLSSWVVSYNYKWPYKSEFDRQEKKSVGSVFANIQNKHSAPGICTLSGDSIFKLWKWTKEPLYLELIKDIALTISQYISSEKCPLYDWDLTREERDSEDMELLNQHRLPNGMMHERVNLSDWETERCIGGVPNGSCWPEASNILTLAELIPVLQEEGLLEDLQFISMG